jgi:hypothetical protein
VNQSERDALRENHVPKECDSHDYCPAPLCGWCVLPYPCDVIKVLDAWEAEKNEQTQFMDQLAEGR